MIDVMVDPDPGPSLGGALAGPGFAAIYVNSSQATDCAVFTLAHELGHALIESAVPLTDDTRFDNIAPMERAANAFANAFLMPAAELKSILDEHEPSPAALAAIMLRFGIGWDLLVDRLHQLGYIEPPDRRWLTKLDRRALAESVHDARARAALLSKSGAPCGLHHAPRWITTRAWIAARRGAIPVEVYATLIGEPTSGVVLPRETLANMELKTLIRAPS